MYMVSMSWPTDAMPSPMQAGVPHPQPADLRPAAVTLTLVPSLLVWGDSMPDDSPTTAASPQSDQQRSQIDFQFLNFSHPSEAKASRARRTVRSHVTRQQHQREHAAAAARRARSFPQPSDQHTDESALEPGHANTFPPPRPTSYDVAGGSSSTLTSSPEVSPSPSPMPSPPYMPEGRVDPADIYPEQWQPYITPILVCIQKPRLHDTKTSN